MESNGSYTRRLFITRFLKVEMQGVLAVSVVCRCDEVFLKKKARGIYRNERHKPCLYLFPSPHQPNFNLVLPFLRSPTAGLKTPKYNTSPHASTAM